MKDRKVPGTFESGFEGFLVNPLRSKHESIRIDE